MNKIKKILIICDLCLLPVKVMNFVKAKLIKINDDGQNNATTPMIGKILKIGNDILSDVVLSEKYDSIWHCEIIEDTLGKVKHIFYKFIWLQT